jgi:hypothetical protein
MSRSLIVALLLLARPVMGADDFTHATVLDVQPVKVTYNSAFCPTLDNCSPIMMTSFYRAVTVEFAGKKYTARPRLINRGPTRGKLPEEVAVGSTIDARDVGHGVIQLRLSTGGKIVQLEVVRVETV